MYTLKICALIALAASMAHAADKPQAAVPQAQAPTATSDMRAHIDPKTGELTQTPTAPQRPERSTVDLSKVEEIHHADGVIEFHFNGQADATQTAQLDADGNLSVNCAEHGTAHAHTAKESNDDHR